MRISVPTLWLLQHAMFVGYRSGCVHPYIDTNLLVRPPAQWWIVNAADLAIERRQRAKMRWAKFLELTFQLPPRH